MRAPFAAGLLLVASCGLGVTENLAGKASHTDGAPEAASSMDALAAEHPNDATSEVRPDLGTEADVGPDLGTDAEEKDGADGEIAEPRPDGSSTGDAADAGVDQAEDAPPDVTQPDAPSDAEGADVAPDATDTSDAGPSSDGPEAGVDGGRSDGQVPTTSCRPSQPFGTPAIVPVTNPGGNFINGRLSADERVAYLSIDTGGPVDIFIAVRADRFLPFGTPTPLAALNSTGFDASPSLTADGLTVYFESNRYGTFHIYRAERSFLGAEFSRPELVSELGGDAAGGPSVTPDGHVLYFHAYRNAVMEIDRVVRNGAGFDPPEPVPGLKLDDGDKYAPIVTPDELVIFFQMGAGIWSASRDTTDLPFGPAVLLSELDTLKASKVPSPIAISPDNCRLYYVQFPAVPQIYVAERLPAN